MVETLHRGVKTGRFDERQLTLSLITRQLTLSLITRQLTLPVRHSEANRQR
jgi:hypothetical protein